MRDRDMAASNLSFASPPVVETVLGVQFNALPKLTSAHLGDFWMTLGADWPDVTDAPPLPEEFERFGEDRSWSRLDLLPFKISDRPEIRILVRNKAGDRMI